MWGISESLGQFGAGDLLTLHSRESWRSTVITVVCLLLSVSLHLSASPDTGAVSGKILDLHGAPVTGARVKLLNSAGGVIREAKSDEQGNFILDGVEPGEYQLRAEEPTFVSVTSDISVARGRPEQMTLQFRQLVSVSQSITVVASAPSLLTPDPARSIVIHDQVLDANPGRPGAPISIPGLPIETASGGIKAPQYFAPGVAGDHGEPIAQFFQIGDFLYPNNLPANAHGNGYADPNFLIPPTIEGVTVDGGAFDVRQGNNSVDLAAFYVPRERLNTFVQITGDYRDVDVMAGWSPSNAKTNAWLAMEASFGNGFLERLEHRQQYKLNGLRQFILGRHELTVFGIGYYGFSDLPGLIPINVPVPGDD
jgi:Carboxypeptidase regulatory-like domain